MQYKRTQICIKKTIIIYTNYGKSNYGHDAHYDA